MYESETQRAIKNVYIGCEMLLFCLAFVLCHEERGYLYSKALQRYLTHENNVLLVANNKDQRKLFSISPVDGDSSRVLLRPQPYEGRVVDMSMSDRDSKLIIHPYHGGRNQRFQLALGPEKVIKITTDNRCFGVDPDGMTLVREECTSVEGGDRQSFEWVSEDKVNDKRNLRRQRSGYVNNAPGSSHVAPQITIIYRE